MFTCPLLFESSKHPLSTPELSGDFDPANASDTVSEELIKKNSFQAIELAFLVWQRIGNDTDTYSPLHKKLKNSLNFDSLLSLLRNVDESENTPNFEEKTRILSSYLILWIITPVMDKGFRKKISASFSTALDHFEDIIFGIDGEDVDCSKPMDFVKKLKDMWDNSLIGDILGNLICAHLAGDTDFLNAFGEYEPSVPKSMITLMIYSLCSSIKQASDIAPLGDIALIDIIGRCYSAPELKIEDTKSQLNELLQAFNAKPILDGLFKDPRTALPLLKAYNKYDATEILINNAYAGEHRMELVEAVCKTVLKVKHLTSSSLRNDLDSIENDALPPSYKLEIDLDELQAHLTKREESEAKEDAKSAQSAAMMLTLEKIQSDITVGFRAILKKLREMDGRLDSLEQQFSNSQAHSALVLATAATPEKGEKGEIAEKSGHESNHIDSQP